MQAAWLISIFHRNRCDSIEEYAEARRMDGNGPISWHKREIQ